MVFQKINWLLIILTLCLTACSHPFLSYEEEQLLYKMRKEWPVSTKDQNRILYDLIHESPSKLAKNAAENGDYRLISLAMGYHASDKDDSVFGLKCTTPVATQTVVFGCVPPPVLIFKLMYFYNISLAQHPDFPDRENCEMPAESLEALKKWETYE